MSYSSVSPSSQKVDDFLSKISQLSQDRLRDSQRTRRSLQSELARDQNQRIGADGESRAPSDFGISEISFNRSGRSQGTHVSDRPPLPVRPRMPGNEFRGPSSSGKIIQSSNHDSLSNSKLSKPGSCETAPSKLSSSDMNEPGPHTAPNLPRRPQNLGSGDFTKRNSESSKFQAPTSFGKPGRPMVPVKPKMLATSDRSEVEMPRDFRETVDAKTGPELPRRPSEVDPRSFGLLRPVASREPLKVGNSHMTQSGSTTQSSRPFQFSVDKISDGKKAGQPGKILSFMDIENRIRNPSKESAPLNFSGSQKSEESKRGETSVSKHAQFSSKSQGKDETASRAVPLKPAKPAKPAKPTLKTFENKDAEILRDQIKRLSPTKTQQNDRQIAEDSTPPKFGFGADAGPSSRHTESKGLRPLKPQKPSTLSREPEAVAALGNLKKFQPKAPVEKPVPEALQRLQNLKKSGTVEKSKPPVPRKISSGPSKEHDANTGVYMTKQNEPTREENPVFETGASPTPETLSKPDFQAKLANIFRSSTAPSLAQSSGKTAPENLSMPPRARTVPEESNASNETQKLTHPNKSRAKGPKRKLPKSQASTSSGVAASTNAGKSFDERTSVTSKREAHLKDELKQPASSDVSGSAHSTESGPHSVSLHVTKPRKTPPTIAKKPNFPIKPTRKFSGEVFI